MNLDVKDKAILAELDFNARKSDAAIGRAVGLSKQNVRYRIQRLRELGVITGFYPVIDNSLRGYYYCRLPLRFQDLTLAAEKNIMAYFQKSETFRWVVRMDGAYDLIAAMWSPTLRYYQDEVNKFMFAHGANVAEKSESIGLSITHLANRAITGGEQKVVVVNGEAARVRVKLDELDEKILKVLSDDARMSLVVIAEKTGSSPSVVNYRIRRMREIGVLKAFRVAFDPSRLGLTHFKIFLYLKSFDESDLTRLTAFLKNEPSVNYIVEEIGICDFDFEVLLSDYAKLLGLMTRLRSLFPTIIRDYKVSVLPITPKISYLPVASE